MFFAKIVDIDILLRCIMWIISEFLGWHSSCWWVDQGWGCWARRPSSISPGPTPRPWWLLAVKRLIWSTTFGRSRSLPSLLSPQWKAPIVCRSWGARGFRWPQTTSKKTLPILNKQAQKQPRTRQIPPLHWPSSSATCAAGCTRTGSSSTCTLGNLPTARWGQPACQDSCHQSQKPLQNLSLVPDRLCVPIATSRSRLPMSWGSIGRGARNAFHLEVSRRKNTGSLWKWSEPWVLKVLLYSLSQRLRRRKFKREKMCCGGRGTWKVENPQN